MEKMDKEEHSAKWKVTKFKWGGAVPTFLRRALPGRRVVPPAVLCVLAYAAASQDLPSASEAGVLEHYPIGMDLSTTMLNFVSLEKLILKRAKPAAFHL